MKHYSFRTTPIKQTNTTRFLRDPVDEPTYPYITYRHRTPIDLNFLLREYVEYNKTIIAVPTYSSLDTAILSDIPIRTSDTTETNGMAYCLRLIGALTDIPMSQENQEILRSQVLTYGEGLYEPIQIPNGSEWTGYHQGPPPAPSVNSPNPLVATMDLAEFFQVALSAVRNKTRDAAETARRGLEDRETINNAAVAQDVAARSPTDPTKSELLRVLLESSRQPGYASGNKVSLGSSENWIKNLVSQILGSQDLDAIERYLSVRPVANCEAAPTGRVPRLVSGDAVVLVFEMRLSRQDGTPISNECPNYPGVPMTIGLRVEHRGPPRIPIGWELVLPVPRPPDGICVTVIPDTWKILVTWVPPTEGSQVFVTVYDTLAMVRRTQSVSVGSVTQLEMGYASPGCHEILATVFVRGPGGSSDPVAATCRSHMVPELGAYSGHLTETMGAMFLVTPPTHPMFAKKYSVMVGDHRTLVVASSTNSFIVPSRDLFCGNHPETLCVRLAPIYLVGETEYVGTYTGGIVLTPPERIRIPRDANGPRFTWRSQRGSCDLVVRCETDGVTVTVGGETREVTGGFAIFRNLPEGEYVITAWCDGTEAVRRCVIVREIETSG